MEVIQVCFNRWTDKQTMVQTYSAMLFGLKKEGNSDICYSIDVPGGHYAKWNKHVTKKKKNTNTVWFCIYEVSRIVKFRVEKMVIAQGWQEGGNRSCCLIEHNFARLRVLKMNTGMVAWKYKST